MPPSRRHGGHADPARRGQDHDGVGLAHGLARLGHRARSRCGSRRWAPTFGIKGGAAGGGYSQVVPMEKLNLHLTGDFHAVTAAHNLLSAMVDNHLHHGNELGIDPRNITWRRVLDVNDRSLRNVVVGLGARMDGVPRQTASTSPPPARSWCILSLATSLADLRAAAGPHRRRLHVCRRPVTADDLGAAGAMAVILKDALKPNLLQTLEGTPALVHAGPFGNIATGNSSVVADLVGSPGAATTSSPRRASAPTWAPSGSSTSSAGSRVWCPTRRSSS
jgi:formate--tetrahydrofolate ligase